MNEHDNFDETPELRQLRELHHGDRMPSHVRERVLRRAQLRREPGRALSGLADTLGHDALFGQADLQGQSDLLAQNAAPANLTRAEPSTWNEASRAAQPKRRRFMLLGAGGGLAAAAAALALWVGVPAREVGVESEHPAPLTLSARPYGADELRALGVQPGVTEVRVVGSLVTSSLTRLPPLPPNHRIRCGYHFHLREPGVSAGDGLHVEYGRCRAPDKLIDDGATCVEVTATGVLRKDGHLDATRVTPRVVTPCTLPN